MATATDGPEAKKFRFSLPTQVFIQPPNYDFNQNNQVQDPESMEEIKLENLANVLESNPIVDDEIKSDTNSEIAENLSIKPKIIENTSSGGQISAIQTPTLPNGQSLMEFSLAMLFQQTNSLLKKPPNKEELKLNLMNNSRTPSNPSASSTPCISAPIPGALAVAASPAAQLFSEDDWSWHRNPAAAIRSGGTNKQTPVWKYFVYNKAENLSRCIIGDCTYMLKGPHTSTLACHLKKHPAEYAEFQRLKMEYTKERTTTQLGSASSSGSGSATSKNPSRSTTIDRPLNLSNGSATGFNHNQSFSNALIKQKIKSEGTINPFNSIFGNTLNPSVTDKNDHAKTPTNGKSGQSMSDLLNLLNARAAAAVAPVDHQSGGISLPSFPPTPLSESPIRDQATVFPNNLFSPSNMTNPLHFMSVLKQHTSAPLVSAPTAADLLHQTKKWQKQDRKQREMEIKLALTLSTAQLPLIVVKNPFFRDLIETAQPKFNMPSDVSQIDEIINTQFSRTLTAIKVQLAATSKIALLIDVLKLNNQNGSANANDETTSGAESEGADTDSTVTASAIRLCVSAAYFSPTTQRMEVALLGIRQPINDLDLVRGIQSAIDMLLEEYDLNMNKVSRVLTNGLQEIGVTDPILPSQLEPYNQKLTQSLLNVFEVDEHVNELKKAFYSMIFGFLSRPDALSQLNKISGRVIELPIAESFLVLAEVLLEIREAFLTVCCQQPLDNPIEILSEQQWCMLENMVKLLSMFRNHMNVLQDGNYLTIDRVVPSLMQLQMSLEKDFPLLGELPVKLKQDLLSRTAYILDPTAEKFDGTWIQATALNPQLAMLLDDAQTMYAKSAIEKLLYEKIRQAEESMARRNGLKSIGGVDALIAAVVERKSSTSSTAQCSTPSAISPPLSSTSSAASDTNGNSPSNVTNSLYPDLMQAAHQRRKFAQEKQQNGKNLYAEAMVQAYFEDLVHSSALINNTNTLLGLPQTPLTAALNAAQHLPPLQFWQFSSVKCAQLSEIAIELLTIPSCTISLERIFNMECDGSATGHSTSSALDTYSMLRSIEDPSRMERDAMLRFNRAHIPKIF